MRRASSGSAEILPANSRPQDLAGRWGGEEFVLFLPDVADQAALNITEDVPFGLRSIPLRLGPFRRGKTDGKRRPCVRRG
ncbi:diguanylate cyclase domain-containing protein [Pseudorhizobium tarimense]|uniref:diguanylate cyclase domain-containing protein n=1 Tax=Pseudorhizobium tarimense TaxID=1079109 RepID=UPI001FF39745|nr:diguanylate cyclase [Pseudorhizobium tarimense]MCJ8519476.1 GGDEF domain-containing protein [Pseudorhizobium tarimense]